MNHNHQTLLFEFGTDGGGAEVILMNDGRIVEKGSAGGMLDEEEDPVRTWEETYESWQLWWDDFQSKHGSDWVWFYPLHIHDSVKPSIRASWSALSMAPVEMGFHVERWKELLDS